MDSQTILILAAAAAVLLIAVFVAAGVRNRRRGHLRDRYGVEYDRLAREKKSQTRAEHELLARERDAKDLPLRDLSAAEATRIYDQWERIEKGFVERPAISLKEADDLVGEVLRMRGYPPGDFEDRSRLLSVHHPRLVESYRNAHRTISVSTPGQLSTEDLRQGLLHYRNLLFELIGRTDRESTIRTEAEVARERERQVGRDEAERVEDRPSR